MSILDLDPGEMIDGPHEAAARYLELGERIAHLQQEREAYRWQLIAWARRENRRTLLHEGRKIRIAPHRAGNWAITVLE